jgi:hypothetical protein
MRHVAVDSDIFFYSVSLDKKDRMAQLATSLLEHISNHPDLELCVPLSVVAASVFKSLIREKDGSDPHKLEIIPSLIDLWRRLEIRFLTPTNRVAEICWHLVDQCGDRMQPTDRTHLGYALAYNMDYFITTDKILLHYRVPEEFRLKVVSLRDARDVLCL